MSNAHSKLSPSSAHRWLKCGMSVKLAEGLPVMPSSKASEEGTTAHAKLEKRLLSYFTGEDNWQGEEGEDAIEIAYNYITSRFEPMAFDVGQVLVETRVDLSFIHDDAFGTADFVGLDAHLKILHIIDFKNGRINVAAIENEQLKLYALGFIKHYNLAEDYTVRLVIIQPNSEGDAIKEYDTTVAELLLWGEYARERAEFACSDNPTFEVGDHCKYCPAQVKCPMYLFSLPINPVDNSSNSTPDPKVIPISDLVTIVTNSGKIKTFLTSCAEYLEALAKEGASIPDMKLVQKRKGNRTWIDEEEAIHVLSPIVGDGIYKELTLKTPAQLEKLLDKKLVAELCFAPDTGVELVHISDRRAEVSLALTPQAVFGEAVALLT